MADKVIGVPFTKEDAAEKGRKGGVNSGRSRRFAKTFREAAEKEANKKTVLKNGEKINGFEAVVASLFRDAVRGNVKASALIIKIMDEMPAERHEMTGPDGKPLMPSQSIDLDRLTDEQRAALLSIGEQVLNGRKD
ncbi:MAG: DUF5681 domain-containing protein [Bacteroidales bacterium]|nr:DUF5681 domain-containing protein [Bacteroidales bacterium]